MTPRPDDRIEAGLAELGRALAYPQADPRLATRVSTAIQAGDSRRTSPWRLREVRTSLVVAVILLLVLAAVAAAVGLGLTRVRIELVPGGAIPSATARGHSALGARLGTRVELETLANTVDFPVVIPATLRGPDAVYVDDGRVSLVWLPDADLPAIEGTDVGLVLTQIDGDVDEGYYEKLVHAGMARIEPVIVRGAPGFWISGAPHALVYRNRDGRSVEETRRMVGDVLIWERGDRTYRLESALGKAATMELAAAIPADD